MTAQLVKEKGKELKQVILNSVSSEKDRKYYDSYQKLNLLPPDKTFPIKEGMELKIGGEDFEIYFPGESHTIDNTVVYLKRKNIIRACVKSRALEFDNPGFTGYANMTEWPMSVEKVDDQI